MWNLSPFSYSSTQILQMLYMLLVVTGAHRLSHIVLVPLPLLLEGSDDKVTFTAFQNTNLKLQICGFLDLGSIILLPSNAQILTIVLNVPWSGYSAISVSSLDIIAPTCSSYTLESFPHFKLNTLLALATYWRWTDEPPWTLSGKREGVFPFLLFVHEYLDPFV